MDPPARNIEMVVGEMEVEVDLGPQVWCIVRNYVPVLADKAQVHYPFVADLWVGLGVRLEDFNQDLGRELGDWSGLGSGTSEGNVFGHFSEA